jgi:hypothetical protein
MVDIQCRYREMGWQPIASILVADERANAGWSGEGAKSGKRLSASCSDRVPPAEEHV